MTARGEPRPAEPGRSLDAWRRELMLTNLELWLAYFALGGKATLPEVGAYLAGEQPLVPREHNVVVLALNEAFLDIGEDHPVPYAAG